jgi:hypothetical protein
MEALSRPSSHLAPGGRDSIGFKFQVSSSRLCDPWLWLGYGYHCPKTSS